MKRSLFFLLLYLPFGVVLAEDELLKSLNQMQDALQNLNYYGTLVFMQGGDVQSMSLAHQATEDGGVERIVNLNGYAREVIRKNDIVTCYLPDSKTVTVSTRRSGKGGWLSKLVANDFAAMQALYLFQMDGEDRVAGYPTRRVLIQPHDAFRYGYRLWLDRDSGLLLKSDLLSESAEILEQAMFAEVSIVDEVPPAMLQPSTRSDDFVWYEESNETEEISPAEQTWRVAEMPVGFKVVSQMRHLLPDSSQLAEHLLITDGLASVSIYIEALDGEPAPFDGPFKRGAVNVYSTALDGHQIVVVGEVPAATVEMMARSLYRQAPGVGND
ncbi:MAG: MucB/RseB C-terminal domain-containing protein [Gammaproteobacteria bacterium]|nr:MucB/RseB C-terminal domain-containing protein [Gammaproteobacteria bacterium]MCF6361856.1 MucB/RseB C-terminal domain-containing protein [Gammaproteobacteria bacterium]